MHDLPDITENLESNLSDPAAQRIAAVLSDLIQDRKAELAQTFYDFMLKDPQAAHFLSAKTVADRLKPGFQHWLHSLFSHQSNDELQAMLAMQRHIGLVHARADIPVKLVARGMRLLKREIIGYLQATPLQRDELIAAILRTDRLIDIAFEEMSGAFVHSHESNVRVDEAYRMFAVGHNLALEREKQLGALLDWENRLFRAIATEQVLNDLFTINNSAFGLWLHHKAALIFDATSELSSIDQSLQRIDDTLLAQFALMPDRVAQSGELRWLVRTIAAEIEQLKFLLVSMFDRMTDLEVGRDVLTRLFNRRFLSTILKREIDLYRQRKTPFCLLMLDIDWFKHVNDQYGHSGGDRVLQNIAGLLLNQVRASDFVFRYGGEEFLIVLAEVDLPQAQAVAEKIRQQVAACITPLAEGQTIQVTASIGVASFDGHPDYLRLVDRADKALYAAKNAGRNRCITVAG